MEFLLIAVLVVLWACGHRIREDLRRRRKPPTHRRRPHIDDPIGQITLWRHGVFDRERQRA